MHDEINWQPHTPKGLNNYTFLQVLSQFIFICHSIDSYIFLKLAVIIIFQYTFLFFQCISISLFCFLGTNIFHFSIILVSKRQINLNGVRVVAISHMLQNLHRGWHDLTCCRCLV
jgi:hypothetical protein